MIKKFLIILKIGHSSKEKSYQLENLKNRLPQPCRLLLSDPNDKIVILTCFSSKTIEEIHHMVSKFANYFSDYSIVHSFDHRSKHNFSPLDIDKPAASELAERFLEIEKRRLTKTVLVERKKRKKYKQNHDQIIRKTK